MTDVAPESTGNYKNFQESSKTEKIGQFWARKGRRGGGKREAGSSSWNGTRQAGIAVTHRATER